MLSKIIAIPFVAGALVFFYLSMEYNDKYAVYIIPCVIALAIIYMLSPQIDWWLYRHRPPKLPAALVRIFSERTPFFQKLPPAEKTRFCHRVALYMESKEFIPKGIKDVPPDIKGVIAASAVQLTFGLDDYLLKKFEHIVVYPHPFPSPQHQEWHASETYEADGVLLFSAEQLMNGFAQPRRFFHVGLYEYAKVFLISYPDIKFPDWPADIWPLLQQISGFSRDAIVNWIGLEEISTTAVVITHFFLFPQKFRKVLPAEYEALAGIFQQRPQ